MTEANKRSFKHVAIMLGSAGILVALIHLIPTGSIAQYILGGLMTVTLVGGIIFFTGLGNPLKKLYRKIFNKEDKK